MTGQQDDLRAGYDAVSAEYARRMEDELAHKPLDRALLGRFADEVSGHGPVCDLGCGPGQIGRYLHDRGVPQVLGVDLSAQMIEQARRLHPQIEFQQGDMLALNAADHGWAGIAAFYSIIHIPRPEVPRALGEMRRVLKPGGLLLLTFHVGEETKHLEEWWGYKVSIDFFFFGREEMEAYVKAAGFEIQEIIARPPYPEVEAQTHRVYILAKKPGQLRETIS